ncbi:MAG: hypothetical protein COT84_02930 [Chlamydiae bacterium CG10_big_fil_rev_8_21_14_0_10_35_9]|nr:MAG: hypothetical protein COT84_02930 [Chlamydiae bacterium CG10_big_fil_rev_8_21_14_0_10_35_9]
MWARIVELFIAGFLIVSGWIFQSSSFLWIFNIITATWIILFSFLSFRHRLRKIHLMNTIAALALAICAFIQPDPPPPPVFQNYMVLALLLIMFAILPTEASKAPVPWRRFYMKK